MKDVSLDDRRKGFMAHLYSFIPGVIVAGIVNYFTGPPWWALWGVLPAWGVGILAHWFFVLGPGAPKDSGGSKS